MTIRPAQPPDAAAIAAAHVASWQGAYRGLLPDALIDSLSVAQRQEFWQRLLLKGSSNVLVVEVDGRIAGFISFGPSRDQDAQPTTAQVYSLNLDPADWRQGYGTALMQAALQQLRDAGYGSVSLWVLDGNLGACSFYEQAGFAPDGVTQVDRMGGAEFSELRYRRAL